MILAMAQGKPFSPEKELLKLIEKPLSRDSQSAAIKYHGQSFFSLGALKGRVAFLSNKFRGLKSAGLKSFDLRLLNQALVVIILLLTVYLGSSATISFMRLHKEIKIDLKAPAASETRPSQATSWLKAASYYLEKARERDIFSMDIRKPDSDYASLLRGPSQKLVEMTENFRLVGISWSSDPDVMIEDVKNPRTLFLKKGQLIDNQIKVEAIFKDKVILSYGGEEIELR